MASKTKQVTTPEGTFTTKVGSNLDKSAQKAATKNVGSAFSSFDTTGLNEAQVKAVKGIQSEFATQTPTSTKYASDSSSVVNGEKNTMNQLQSYLNQSADIKDFIKTSMNSINDINTYAAELDARGRQQEGDILRRYGDAKAATIEGQKGETASMNTNLTTRLGGYLGGSASHVGALQNLAQTHKADLLKLDAQRDEAIQAAQNAIVDKKFALARMKADEIKSLSSEIYKRQQDFFQNTLTLQRESREMKKDDLEYLKTISTLDDAELDPQRAAEIDSQFGVPGFTEKYMTTARAAAQAESRKAQIEGLKSYMELLESVPQGMQVPLGDEMITGIGKTSDISTYQVEDASGNVRIVAYNKRTGTMNMTNAGQIGTPSSSGGSGSASFNDQFRSDKTMVLDNGQKIPVIDAQGYVNPIAWKNIMDSAQEKKVPRADFIKQYGYLLYAPGGEVSNEYGLTQQEKKLITSY